MANGTRPVLARQQLGQRPLLQCTTGSNGSNCDRRRSNRSRSDLKVADQPILLKNFILQEHEFLANAQCISQLALRIAEAVAKCAVVARNNQLRGPPRLKMRDASMGLEFLAQVRKGSFSTE